MVKTAAEYSPQKHSDQHYGTIMKIYAVIVLILTVSNVGKCGFIELFKIVNTTTPLIGQTYQFKCTVGGNKTSANIKINHHSDYENAKDLVCRCHLTTGCQGPGCSIQGNDSISYVISNANKSNEGDYECLTSEGMNHSKKELAFKVYTLPDEIKLENPPSKAINLWETGVTFECKTDGCVYGDPKFKWYYKTLGSGNEFASDSEISNSSVSCSYPEVIFKSHLTLSKNATDLTIGQTAARFQCEFLFEDIDFSRKTNYTNDVYFAVNVSNVYLQVNQRNLTKGAVLNVTQGEDITLTCITGTSRPASTINWYINDYKQATTGGTFTFSPQNANHNKNVYCAAYNLQPETKAVQSQKPKLYVKVQVANVYIQSLSRNLTENDVINVTQGEEITLTCITGTSRPNATITWYIDNNKRTETGFDFNYIPRNSDHDKRVYCTAYNLQPETFAVVSENPKLYVKVIAESPLIENGTTFFDGDSYYVQCKSSATRPPANMAWMLKGKPLTNTTIKYETGNDKLVRGTSTVHLQASKMYHDAEITCQSWITGQVRKKETSKTVTIFWRPVGPTVTAVTEFPWQEHRKGELNCSATDSGNPTSTITWVSDVKIDYSENRFQIGPLSYLDNNRSVKCKLENNFTLKYAETVISKEVRLDIQYTPKIFLEDTVLATRPKENITVTIPFLTNPNFTSLKLLMNESSFNSSKYDLAVEDYYVERDSHERKVDQMGYKLDFTVLDLQKNDFTTYVITFENGIGAANASFNITSESKPLAPVSFTLLRKRGTTLIFYWEQSFNGGHTQTFWIQVTESHKDNWENKTVVDEFDNTNYLGNESYIANISGLDPGTYSIRLIAANIKGQTEPVMLRSSVTIDSPDRATQAFPVGAAAGGGVGAAGLIIFGVIIFVVWKRRSNSTLTKDDSKKKILTPKRDSNKPDDADIAEVNINPMYESADPVQLPTNDVYAEVNKQSRQRQPGAPSDVNAQVIKQKGVAASGSLSDQTPAVAPEIYSSPVKKGKDKTPAVAPEIYSSPVKKGKGKQKKEKKQAKKSPIGKQNEGTVYENASSPIDTTKDPDNVYENPACTISEEKPKRTKNEDGLIYIEVELSQQKESKNQKPVIHGEDRTIYADVAYGKVGEQMPESDEETPKES